jgi:hypothetical protein
LSVELSTRWRKGAPNHGWWKTFKRDQKRRRKWPAVETRRKAAKEAGPSIAEAEDGTDIDGEFRLGDPIPTFRSDG